MDPAKASTLEGRLREWVGAGRGELTASASVTGYGVVLSLGPTHSYVTQDFMVSGNELIPLTEPAPGG